MSLPRQARRGRKPAIKTEEGSSVKGENKVKEEEENEEEDEYSPDGKFLIF
jgi:hypothetical protein